MGAGIKASCFFSVERAGDTAGGDKRFFRTMDWLILKLPFALLPSIVLLAWLPVCAQEKSTASPTTVVPANSEVRALWVVRTTLTSPEKIRTMVQSAKDNGFNTLIVQVRGRGDAFYRSSREPRAAELKDQSPE